MTRVSKKFGCLYARLSQHNSWIPPLEPTGWNDNREDSRFMGKFVDKKDKKMYNSTKFSER